MTGRNPIKNGVLGNGQFLRPDLASCGIRTWPEYLVESGYTTAAVGKMHFYPWDASLGFQRRIICEDKRWIKLEDDYERLLRSRGHYKYHGNEHEGYQENRGAVVSRLPCELYWDHFVGDQASKYIRDYRGDAPFALMVGFPGPHCPYDPPEEYASLYRPEDMPDPVPEAEGQPRSFREGNIKGNKAAWNGVDYTVFTREHMLKIRSHYAGQVKLIDDEVGAILEALEETGRLENTVVILSSDHGDYLGDHGLIGKGTFYEASARVPLLVRAPDVKEARVHGNVASLGDVTATLMHYAGCGIPAHYDSRPLADLDIAGARPRERVFGFLSGACMNTDGVWKLAKYATGDVVLFNLEEDPGEQHNRADDPSCLEVRRRLDAEMTSEMMRSIVSANSEKGVGTDWADPTFAEMGWRRTYPLPLGTP